MQHSIGAGRAPLPPSVIREIAIRYSYPHEFTVEFGVGGGASFKNSYTRNEQKFYKQSYCTKDTYKDGPHTGFRFQKNTDLTDRSYKISN